MRTLRKLIVIAVLAFALHACLEVQEASIVPEIELIGFEWFQGVDSLLGNPAFIITQTIGFTDGDGDVGSNDSLEKQLFVTPLKKIKGILADTLDTLEFNIPYIEPVKTVRTMTGEIECKFLIQELGGFEQNDTLIFETHIIDRSGHVSNIVATKKDFIFSFDEN
jgi:hypothetical protein